jgi:formylglycine-generating enzyme required for sulfatase activity
MKSIAATVSFHLMVTLTVVFLGVLAGCGQKEDASKFVALKPKNANDESISDTNSFIVATPATRPKVGESFKDCAACPELVVIPAGNFKMGGKRAITIGYELAVGKFEVTQKQFMALAKSMTMNNPARFDTCGENCPVEQVHWHTANRYIERLNERTGLRYRLLSESEWEYAARAGTTSAYGFGEDAKNVGEHAWYYDNAESTKPVGTKLPNAWGLYDMQGNVEEWVGDCVVALKDIPVDGRKFGGNNCAYFSVRGGSWSHPREQLMLKERGNYGAEYQESTVGFRIARELK